MVHPEGSCKPMLRMSMVGEAALDWLRAWVEPTLDIQQRGTARSKQEHGPQF